METSDFSDMDFESLFLEALNLLHRINFVQEKLAEEEGLYLLEVHTTKIDGIPLSDLLRKLKRMLKEVEKRLLNHVTEPLVISDTPPIVRKIAESIMERPEFYKSYIKKQFTEKLSGMIDRIEELDIVLVKESPTKMIIDRMKEAFECYIYGFFQASAVLCRAILEESLRDLAEKKFGKRPSEQLTDLLKGLEKYKLISKELLEKGLDIRDVGNKSAHDPEGCSPKDALRSITNTRMLLEALYKKQMNV
jgi:hypothetical protein